MCEQFYDKASQAADGQVQSRSICEPDRIQPVHIPERAPRFLQEKQGYYRSLLPTLAWRKDWASCNKEDSFGLLKDTSTNHAQMGFATWHHSNTQISACGENKGKRRHLRFFNKRK